MQQPSWKEICQSPGYKSLKQSYITTVQQDRGRMRSKEELYSNFRSVISRAKHYAHHQNRSIIDVLNQWEAELSCNFLNRYNGIRRLTYVSPKRPTTMRGVIRNTKRYAKVWDSKPDKVNKEIQRFHKFYSNKKPERYSTERKARHKLYNEWKTKSVR